MSESPMPLPLHAPRGDKMIEVRIRFWTDKLSSEKDTVFPKHAWDHGVVVMDCNKSHGIVPQAPQPFNSILELQAVLAKVLTEHGVTLHTGRKLRKLVKAQS